MAKIDLINDNCLKAMKNIPDKSIDLICCDLPYGSTVCKWDSIIDLSLLWEQYRRIIKKNGAIVLTASQPFTTKLISSNYEMFRYALVWDKVAITNPMLAKKQPLRCHEDIVIFYNGQPTYNPQMRIGIKWKRGGKKQHETYLHGQSVLFNNGGDTTDLKYPKSILTFSNADKTKNIHPTQKPLSLIEFLVSTYSNENDTILDNAMGGGTCGVVCKNLNRNFIGIEMDEKYFKMAESRINGTN